MDPPRFFVFLLGESLDLHLRFSFLLLLLLLPPPPPLVLFSSLLLHVNDRAVKRRMTGATPVLTNRWRRGMPVGGYSVNGPPQKTTSCSVATDLPPSLPPSLSLSLSLEDSFVAMVFRQFFRATISCQKC